MGEQDRQVVITGLGPVTSIGTGGEALWESLVAGRCNAGFRSLATDIGVSENLAIATMPEADQVPGLGPHLEFLEQQEATGHRDLAYSLLAAELALADAGVEYDRAANKIGVIQVFEAPGVEQLVHRLFGMMQMAPPPGAKPHCYEALAPSFYKAQPFIYVHLLGKALGLHGFSTSVHNACSSGAFALELAAQHIRAGQADVMVVAGGEAFDTAVRLEWFRRLEMYANEPEAMKPFDSASGGFYVGEGAAALVLESAEHAAKRGAATYATYRGGTFNHQAWKQSIPDAKAGRLADAISQALCSTRITPAELDLIVPHGASTPLSDGYEAQCLQKALEDEATHAVATVFKPNVGHMLAASGLIELVCMMLCLKHQAVTATLHSEGTAERLKLPLITQHTDRPLRTAMKLSTGFTGHDAASIFTRD